MNTGVIEMFILMPKVKGLIQLDCFLEVAIRFLVQAGCKLLNRPISLVTTLVVVAKK